MKYAITYKIPKDDMNNKNIVDHFVKSGIYNLKSEYPDLMHLPDKNFRVDAGLHEDDFIMNKITLRISVSTNN